MNHALNLYSGCHDDAPYSIKISCAIDGKEIEVVAHAFDWEEAKFLFDREVRILGKRKLSPVLIQLISGGDYIEEENTI